MGKDVERFVKHTVSGGQSKHIRITPKFILFFIVYWSVPNCYFFKKKDKSYKDYYNPPYQDHISYLRIFIPDQSWIITMPFSNSNIERNKMNEHRLNGRKGSNKNEACHVQSL